MLLVPERDELCATTTTISQQIGNSLSGSGAGTFVTPGGDVKFDVSPPSCVLVPSSRVALRPPPSAPHCFFSLSFLLVRESHRPTGPTHLKLFGTSVALVTAATAFQTVPVICGPPALRVGSALQRKIRAHTHSHARAQTHTHTSTNAVWLLLARARRKIFRDGNFSVLRVSFPRGFKFRLRAFNRKCPHYARGRSF